MKIDSERLQIEVDKYVKPEYHHKAYQMLADLISKQQNGTLSTMDVLKNLPKAKAMLKPEYHDDALNFLKKLKQLK